MSSPACTTAENAAAYLELHRLLDDLERQRPDVSGPLRLTLLRARRDRQATWLDTARFRTVVDDLLRHDRVTDVCRPARAGA